MRVAIDTSALYTSHAGVARYVRGLLRGLSQLRNPGITISELAWPVTNLEYHQPRRALRTFYREIIWARSVAPGELLRNQIDVLHSAATCLVAPPKRVRHVATLHDVAVLRYPERFRLWQRWSSARRFRQLEKVDKIVCDSRFTADEAMALLGLPANKLEVVYLGCGFEIAGGTVAEKAPDSSVPNDFFLFVGSLEPGKNLALLRKTYRLAESHGTPLPPLLIVGARWAGVAGEGAPPQGWHYLGRQPDEVLAYLYRRALALVFPSKYEGFGLPLTEAMMLGCPVICSRVASLPEVGGDAVMYTEMSADGYWKSMKDILSTPSLREELIPKGREQAGKFSWDKCAAETASVYKQAFGA
jgi:glycosyltransferase involved in cell wall biosynthesis